ncbi:MAG: nuclear transport factor 2 family protein, partial [Bifidobacteriaceae bacterium]|nr:nuclear transport factor 2 family protein [Bifidobacteriaceae bacterium]
FVRLSHDRSVGRLADRHALGVSVLVPKGEAVRAYTEFAEALTDFTSSNPDGVSQTTAAGLFVDVLEPRGGVWTIIRRTVYPKTWEPYSGPYTGYRVGDFHGSRSQLDSFAQRVASLKPPTGFVAPASGAAVEAAAARAEVEATLAAVDLAWSHAWWERLGDLLSDDLEYVSGGLGADAASGAEYVAAVKADRAIGLVSAQRVTANPIIEVEGDTARVLSEFATVELTSVAEAKSRFVIRRVDGAQEDTLRIGPEGWRLTSRRVVVKAFEERDPEAPAEAADSISRSGKALAALPQPTALRLPPHFGDAKAPGLPDRLALDRVAIRELHAAVIGAVDHNTPELGDGRFADGFQLVRPLGSAVEASQVARIVDQIVFWRLNQAHKAFQAPLWFDGNDSALGYSEFVTITILRADEPHLLRYLRSSGVFAHRYQRTTEGWKVASRAILRTSSTLRDVPLDARRRRWLAAVDEFLASARPRLGAIRHPVAEADQTASS